MRTRGWWVGLLLALLVCAPSAAAASFTGPVGGDLSTRTSLLVAGQLLAVSSDAPFAVPRVERVDFGDAMSVQYCPESGARPDPTECSGGETLTNARLRILAGGFLVRPLTSEPVRLRSPAGVAALGGGNLSLLGMHVGPAIAVGGPTELTSEGTEYELRPIDADSSIEIRSEEGFRVYNGTRHRLQLADADGAFVATHGALLTLPENATLDVRAAELSVAERELDVILLHEVLLDVLPRDQADRRADVVEAFGPFQLVPALLNGVVAARTNLTVDGHLHEAFHLVRVGDAHFTRDADQWIGQGNATYSVEGARLVTSEGGTSRALVVVLALVAAVALLARVVVPRDPYRRPERRRAVIASALGALLLGYWALREVRGLVGIDLARDFDDLVFRSRVQLLLYALAVFALAALAVWGPVSSLTRSLLTRFDFGSGAFSGPLVGALAATVAVAWASPTFLALAARLVRL